MTRTMQCLLLAAILIVAYAAFRGIVDYQPAGATKGSSLEKHFLELERNTPKAEPKSDLRTNIEAWLQKRYGVAQEVAEAISAQAEELEHGLMLVAILSVESSGNPQAKLANNYGLCQVSDVHLEPDEMRRIRRLKFQSLEDCGVEKVDDLFNIKKNMCAANAVFDRLYRTGKGNVRVALINYNANDKYKHDYQRKVLANYRSLAKAAGLPADYSPSIEKDDKS